MVRHINKRQGRLAMRSALGVSMVALVTAMPLNAARAQDPAQQAAPLPAATTAMINLISLLIKQGTITPERGMELLQQAQGEAARAHGNIEQAASNAGVTPPPPPPAPPGVVRVPYVPETVRKQIAEQVRNEIMGQAKAEGWAAPSNAAPDWTRRITISGDIRVRSQSNLFSKLNADNILDYAAINATSGGFDFLNDAGNNMPFLNTRQDRINRLRLRARLGIDADINKYVRAGIRIATGDDTSPISTNENLGGGLAKRDIWLDRAFVELRPVKGVNLAFGRFDNPFWNTNLLFDDDLNFDGVAATVSADHLLSDNLRLSLTGGAFPLDFGSADHPDTSQTKSSYPSKWLLSGQIRADYQMDNGLEIGLGAAYHHFRNVQGRLSEPCLFAGLTVPLGSNDPVECSTDGTRAFFPRKGNTYFFVRQLVYPSNDISGPGSEKQYLGLVQRFHVLDFNASVAFPVSDTIKAELFGEYIKNLAFDRGRNCRYGSLHGPVTNVITTALNNDNACTAVDPATVASGDYGWLAGFQVGHPDPRKWGEWAFAANYRYLQTDATLDSLTESEFHLGGTNTKGYTIEGTLGLLPGTSLTARWMSANEITGAPLSIDVLQVDLSAEF